MNTFVYIYTSVEADFDVSEYKSEVEYEGKTLVSSGKGFSEMTAGVLFDKFSLQFNGFKDIFYINLHS